MTLTQERISDRRAKVVPIDFGRRRQPVPGRPAHTHRVPQARLAEGLKLHLEEMRIARELREFRMQLEADLAAGSEVEAGDLVFDPELKIVRRETPSATGSR